MSRSFREQGLLKNLVVEIDSLFGMRDEVGGAPSQDQMHDS